MDPLRGVWEVVKGPIMLLVLRQFSSRKNNCVLTASDVLYITSGSYTLETDSNAFTIWMNMRSNLINITIHVRPIHLKEGKLEAPEKRCYSQYHLHVR